MIGSKINDGREICVSQSKKFLLGIFNAQSLIVQQLRKILTISYLSRLTGANQAGARI
jgi:hypothetical protein